MFCILYTIEELPEMLGVIVLIYALLPYIGSEFSGFVLTFNSEMRKTMSADKMDC